LENLGFVDFGIMYNRKPINPNSYIHHPSGDSSKRQLREPFTKEQVSLSNNAFKIEGLVTVGKLVDALKSYASRTCISMDIVYKDCEIRPAAKIWRKDGIYISTMLKNRYSNRTAVERGGEYRMFESKRLVG
jgi:hypothetical protein